MDFFPNKKRGKTPPFSERRFPPLRELGHRWPCPPKVGGRGLRRLVFVGDLVHLWCKHLWYLSIYSIHLSTHIYSMYHLSSLPPYCLPWQKKAGKLSATCPYENSEAPNISSAANQVAITKRPFSAGLWSREIKWRLLSPSEFWGLILILHASYEFSYNFCGVDEADLSPNTRSLNKNDNNPPNNAPILSSKKKSLEKIYPPHLYIQIKFDQSPPQKKHLGSFKFKHLPIPWSFFQGITPPDLLAKEPPVLAGVAQQPFCSQSSQQSTHPRWVLGGSETKPTKKAASLGWWVPTLTWFFRTFACFVCWENFCIHCWFALTIGTIQLANSGFSILLVIFFFGCISWASSNCLVFVLYDQASIL